MPRNPVVLLEMDVLRPNAACTSEVWRRVLVCVSFLCLEPASKMCLIRATEWPLSAQNATHKGLHVCDAELLGPLRTGLCSRSL